MKFPPPNCPEMIRVVTGTFRERDFVSAFARPMHELRYKIFHERLAWHVVVNDGKELDEFDDDDSAYILTTKSSGIVVGGWRLRPTLKAYMLHEVFPQLLCGKPAPADRSIWEISRFAVRDDTARGPNFGLGQASRALITETVKFAIKNSISQYVMVVSVAVERLLRSFGLKLHRFGSPQRVGHVMSVAVWLDVDMHTRNTILNEDLPLRLAA